MIDAVVNGNVIRKRKYRRDNTMIFGKWFDYNGVEVTDSSEISRLDRLAVTHAKVDKAYDDHAAFMESVNFTGSLSGLPMDKHMVVVEWIPDSDQGFLGMRYPEGLEGDSYYVVVINAGRKSATMYTPHNDEPPKDDPAAVVDDDYVNIGGSYVAIDPGQAERARVTFRGGKWYWELVTKTYVSNGSGIQIGQIDFLTFRYLWEDWSGTDLDTATEFLNSRILGVDDMAVGWACPGNNKTEVTSLLKWGGDNTGSGKECVWMSVKELRENHNSVLPVETNLMAYATWFASKGNGRCSFELKGYKGGTMTQEGYNFINTGGDTVYSATHDFTCNTMKGVSDYKNLYTQIARVTYNKNTNNVYMSIGDAIKEEDNYQALERQIEQILIKLKDFDDKLEQALYVTLDHVPTSSDVSYVKEGKTIAFLPGAIVRYVDPGTGDYAFYKIADLTNGVPTWVALIDSRYGNVRLETTYTDRYEIANVTSGSRLTAVNSKADDIKFVNSTVGNLTMVMNATVASPAVPLTSMLAVNEVILTPGAAASFTRNGDKYVLTELFGMTIFPDLADGNREGEWVMSVSPTGRPTLMEVADMRKWDESIVRELTIDELNERYPDVEIGFTVVCKTINKAYEMVNGYKEWVSYDITSIN